MPPLLHFHLDAVDVARSFLVLLVSGRFLLGLGGLGGMLRFLRSLGTN